jgi:hypothetical protein
VSGLKRRRHTSTADGVAQLLSTAMVDRRSGRGGTLMTEPVVVVHGRHRGDFELLDQDGGRLGSAVRVGGMRSVDAARSYEVRDAHDRYVLHLHEAELSSAVWGLTKWHYEVVLTGESGKITVQKTSPEPTSISHGPRRIGTMRNGPTHAFLIEDHTGREVARIHIARTRFWSERVDLIAEIEDGTSVPLRSVALAATVIADRELIKFGQ